MFVFLTTTGLGTAIYKVENFEIFGLIALMRVLFFTVEQILTITALT